MNRHFTHRRWLDFTGVLVIACVAAAAGVLVWGSGNSTATSGAVDAQEITRSLAGDAPGAQAVALADGVVTIGELAAAAAAARDCIAAKGFVATVVLPARGNRIAGIEWTVPAVGKDDTAGLDARHAELMACNHEYFDATSLAWQAEHIPTPEQARAMYAWLAACLTSTTALDPATTANFNVYPTTPADLRLDVTPGQTSAVHRLRRRVQGRDGIPGAAANRTLTQAGILAAPACEAACNPVEFRPT
jgi:hypothetical protein